MEPLPQLGAGNFRSRRVFHQVMDRHAAEAIEPGREIAHTDIDVVDEAGAGDATCGWRQQIGRRHAHVLAQTIKLVGARHDAIEFGTRHGDQRGVCHPGPVMAGFGFALLVGAHLGHRDLVRFRVATDRNLRGHAAHRERTATMADADQPFRIRLQEGYGHANLATLGQDKVAVAAKRLDAGKDVIPAPAIEAYDALAQLPQDLIHLERGGQGLDEDGDLDRARHQAEHIFGVGEHRFPQGRFRVALQFRQIQERPALLLRKYACVVQDEQSEVEQGRADRLAIHAQMLFVQMPAARPHHEDSRVGIEPVLAPIGRLVVNASGHRIDQVGLPVDEVVPGRRG